MVQEFDDYLWSLGFIVLAVIIGLLIHSVTFNILQRLTKRDYPTLAQSLPRHVKAPLRLLIPTLAVRITLPGHAVNLHPMAVEYVGTLLSTLIILSAAWLLIRLTKVLEEWMLLRHDIKASDNLQARKILTQMDIVRKILVFVIVIFALAAVMMQFESFRRIGTGLLASAGVAGLVLGFAAQQTIANVLAGFQIALTQPIRIDDVVIVENEWGRIEEITLTYVVVAIWDMRRLVLPISYFLEQPFQNWTRTSAEILGTVYLYVDYTVPIGTIRAFLGDALKESSSWDGEVWGLSVTNSGEHTVELRALMSAASSGDAWELRCEIREKLIEYVQKNFPGALPRVRAEVLGEVFREAGGKLGETAPR